MDRQGGVWAYDMVIWIFRMIVVVVMIIIFLMFQNLMFKTNIIVQKGESYLMIDSMLFSPDGFSYTANGRTYPGVIVIDRFNAGILNKSFFINLADESEVKKRNHWAYNITLFDSNKQQIKSIVWNNKMYRRWIVRAGTGLLGSGGAIRIIENYYVTIRHPDRIEQGYLRVDVLRPRE